VGGGGGGEYCAYYVVLCPGFLAIYLVFVLLVGFGRVVYVRQKTAKATLHSAHEQQRQREARVAARNREEAMQSQHMAPLLNVGGANSGIRKLRSRSHDTLALLAGLDPQRAKRGEYVHAVGGCGRLWCEQVDA